MIQHRIHRWFFLLCAAAILGPVSLASAKSPKLEGSREVTQTVRPELGEPVQAAQELVRAHKFKEALAKLREADKVAAKTDFEVKVLEQTRLIAATGADDPATAAAAFGVLDRHLADAEQRGQFLRGIGGSYYRVKEYAKAAQWLERYFKEGGNDVATRSLLPMSYFLAGDDKAARTAAAAQIAAIEANGNAVASESLYRVALDAAMRMKDEAGVAVALERLVAAHPKPIYWSHLLRRLEVGTALPDRLKLDVARLRLAVGAAGAADVVSLAEDALHQGFPGEAKSALEAGYAKGILGSGDGAARQARLRAAAAKAAADDLKGLAAAEAEARAKPKGDSLVNAGLAAMGHGDAAKAVSLIEEGIAKGAQHPAEAKLHLGIAQAAAKQKAKAVATFKALARESAGGVSTLARLWLVHLGQGRG